MAKSNLSQLQQNLQAAIIDAEVSIPSFIANQPPLSNTERLSIYQTAYRQRLRETLDTDHELLGLYLGDKLYDQLVASYITAFPSAYRSLRHFADQLPEFLATAQPFSDYPTVSELARFERCLMTAFDAQDAEPMTSDDLVQLPTADWPELNLRLHPSAQLFQTEWNSVDIWQALKTASTPPDPVQSPATWLVWRNSERLTEFRSLDPEEVSLISLIIHGINFAGLCDYLLTHYEPEVAPTKAVTYLHNWIAAGLLRKPLPNTPA